MSSKTMIANNMMWRDGTGGAFLTVSDAGGYYNSTDSTGNELFVRNNLATFLNSNGGNVFNIAATFDLVEISSNSFSHSDKAGTFGVAISDTIDTLRIYNNAFQDINDSPAVSNIATGARHKVTRLFDNLGYNNVEKGTATITSGNTVVTVTHNLDVPNAAVTLDAIQVTPLDSLGAATKFWAETTGVSIGDQFKIHVNAAPG